MGVRTKPFFLSREEEAELARSNKKVKDVHHAGFSQGPGARSPSPSPPPPTGSLARPTSFKDKLLGEIPGAYSRAFAFSDQMEADADSDEEV